MRDGARRQERNAGSGPKERWSQAGSDPHIFTMPYNRHKVVVFVNKTHRFARRRRIRFAELEGERMEVSDADIHTTAHVNCLMERRKARLIDAFFDVAAQTKRP